MSQAPSDGDGACGSVLSRRELTVSEAKTDESWRTVSLSAPMVALLKAQKAAQARERLRAANVWRESGYVFTTEAGEPVDPRNLLRLSIELSHDHWWKSSVAHQHVDGDVGTSKRG